MAKQQTTTNLYQTLTKSLITSGFVLFIGVAFLRFVMALIKAFLGLFYSCLAHICPTVLSHEKPMQVESASNYAAINKLSENIRMQ